MKHKIIIILKFYTKVYKNTYKKLTWYVTVRQVCIHVIFTSVSFKNTFLPEYFSHSSEFIEQIDMNTSQYEERDGTF